MCHQYIMDIREIEERGFSKSRPPRTMVPCDICGKKIRPSNKRKHEQSITCLIVKEKAKRGEGVLFSKRNAVRPTDTRPYRTRIPLVTKEGKREDEREERKEDKKTLELVKENNSMISRMFEINQSHHARDMIRRYHGDGDDQKLNERLRVYLTAYYDRPTIT
jgi:hypothetical protein